MNSTISKEQVEIVRPMLYLCNGNEQDAALEALLSIGDRIASGEFVLVPRVPTEAMIDAGYKAGYTKLHPYAGAPAWAKEAYRAMLEAAQKESPAQE